jgi:hypothetical protein
MCTLLWSKLAEDGDVFFEKATDPMPQFPHNGLRNLAHHDNHHTLLELGDIATKWLWLLSAPRHDATVGHLWLPMPKLDTFTSRPMPVPTSSTAHPIIAVLISCGTSPKPGAT